MFFSDTINKYVILDYACSHNQLLLRGMKNANRDYNIDIIFKGVKTLLVSSTFEGIAIDLFNSELKEVNAWENFNFQRDTNYKIYEIKSQDKKYYINAMNLYVYHNKLDILETSIGRYDMGDLNEVILSF